MNMLTMLVEQVIKEPASAESQKEEPPKLEWTSQMISDLGKITDAEFSIRHNISRYRVYNKRKAMGINAAARNQSHNKKHIWPDNEADLFRRYTNREVSELLDIPYASVLQRRHALQIQTDPALILVDAELTDAEMELRRKAQERERQQQEKCKAIVAMHADGKNYQEIAKELKVSLVLVSASLKDHKQKSHHDNREALQDIQDTLNISVDTLDIMNKVKQMLKLQGVHTLGDLVNLSKADLLSIPNFGRIAFADVVIALERHGLKIKEYKK